MLILACFWLFGLAGSAAPASATEPASEQSVRAALLFNFIKFTEWPAPAAGHPQLRVCNASSDAKQIVAIEALNDFRVRGKLLVAARFRHPADCDVIYVDSPQRWKAIAERSAMASSLTVGAYAGFVADGGMIEISLQDGSVRFDINLLEARRAGLRIYPQLLRLARRVAE
jgi:hypothetical protein